MQRRQLIAAFLGGLLLLSGFAVAQHARRVRLRLVGVTAEGDTLWLDGSRRDSTYFGLVVASRDRERDGVYTIAVNCVARSVSPFGDDVLNAAAPGIADTACAMLRRP